MADHSRKRTPSSHPDCAILSWMDRHVAGPFRHFRLAYLPPLMVYLAAGISGLTGIAGTFFVKDYLGLSPEFLAMLGFWAGLPWALKMPLGHLVDLIWRWKFVLVFLGAALIGGSLAIMIGLIGFTEDMVRHMSVEAWFVLAGLLAPAGYVVQDVVADAMTVEAVPTISESGIRYDDQTIKRMHTTMQTLGRVAIVGGGIAVSLLNVFIFDGIGEMPDEMKRSIYTRMYALAMVIPAISVLGVILSEWMKRRRARKLQLHGNGSDGGKRARGRSRKKVRPDWWILGGSLVFFLFTLATGLSRISYSQEVVFLGSMAVVLFLMTRLLKALPPPARRTLVQTAVIIFVFRALPGPGAGATWWQIDALGFDQQFMSVLSLISGGLALAGMFIFRRFMAERSIAYVVGFLTVVGAVLSLPLIGMYYGLHQWTSAVSSGVVDARFIAVIDTALESPLGQVAMIPMLAWIANSAPEHMKATFFAVMASFTNLALSLSHLGTQYLNRVFTVSREIIDPITEAVSFPADYSELGTLLITVSSLGLVLPMLTIWLVNFLPARRQKFGPSPSNTLPSPHASWNPFPVRVSARAPMDRKTISIQKPE